MLLISDKNHDFGSVRSSRIPSGKTRKPEKRRNTHARRFEQSFFPSLPSCYRWPTRSSTVLLLPDLVWLGRSGISAVGPSITTEHPHSFFRSKSSLRQFVRVAAMRRRRNPPLVPHVKIAISRQALADKRIWRIGTPPPVANTETVTKETRALDSCKYAGVYTGELAQSVQQKLLPVSLGSPTHPVCVSNLLSTKRYQRQGN